MKTHKEKAEYKATQLKGWSDLMSLECQNYHRGLIRRYNREHLKRKIAMEATKPHKENKESEKENV